MGLKKDNTEQNTATTNFVESTVDSGAGGDGENNSKLLAEKNCSLCSKKANYSCEVCLDNYCSKKCQIIDWRKHRLICMPLPNLILNPNTKILLKGDDNENTSDVEEITTLKVNKQTKNENLIKKDNSLKVKPIEDNNSCIEMCKAKLPKNGDQIMITYILGISIIYVRPLNKDEEFINLLKVINEESKHYLPLQKLPCKNDWVAAEYEGDYYRALVTEDPKSENDIKVMFVDFGNIEVTNKNGLKILPSKAINFECYTVPITLKGVPEKVSKIKEDKIMNYLNSFVENPDTKLIINIQNLNEKGNPLAKIKHVEENIILNDVVLQMLNDTEQVEIKQKFLTKKNFEFKRFNDGENVDIIICDNSYLSKGLISCILPKDAEIVFNYLEKFKSYAETNKESYKPKISEVCIVQFEEDNGWYRGECLSYVDCENCLVSFIDFGNEAQCNINNIRKYPTEFLQIPITTNLCKIEDFPVEKKSQEAIERIQSVIPINDKIKVSKIKVLETENGEVITISIKNLLK